MCQTFFHRVYSIFRGYLGYLPEIIAWSMRFEHFLRLFEHLLPCYSLEILYHLYIFPLVICRSLDKFRITLCSDQFLIRSCATYHLEHTYGLPQSIGKFSKELEDFYISFICSCVLCMCVFFRPSQYYFSSSSNRVIGRSTMKVIQLHEFFHFLVHKPTSHGFRTLPFFSKIL